MNSLRVNSRRVFYLSSPDDERKRSVMKELLSLGEETLEIVCGGVQSFSLYLTLGLAALLIVLLAVTYCVKKEYFENLMNEIANELNIKKENEKTYLISKIKTLVYTLYRYDKYKGKREFNENNTISCAKEWESFTRIGNTIKDAVIKSVKGDKS